MQQVMQKKKQEEQKSHFDQTGSVLPEYKEGELALLRFTNMLATGNSCFFPSGVVVLR